MLSARQSMISPSRRVASQVPDSAAQFAWSGNDSSVSTLPGNDQSGALTFTQQRDGPRRRTGRAAATSGAEACLRLVRLSVWIVGWPAARGLINMENSICLRQELAVLDVLGTVIEPEPVCLCRARAPWRLNWVDAELWSAEHGPGERGRCRDHVRCE